MSYGGAPAVWLCCAVWLGCAVPVVLLWLSFSFLNHIAAGGGSRRQGAVLCCAVLGLAGWEEASELASRQSGAGLASCSAAFLPFLLPL